MPAVFCGRWGKERRRSRSAGRKFDGGLRQMRSRALCRLPMSKPAWRGFSALYFLNAEKANTPLLERGVLKVS